MKKFLFILLLLLVIATGAGLYLQNQWQAPGAAAEGDEGIVEIPRGMGARGIVRLLEEKKVIPNRNAAFAYILIKGVRNRLQAGEYQFDHPMTIPEVIGKIARGAVYLRKFTIPEGLVTVEIAQRWQDQGFGTREEFLTAAEQALDAVRQFAPAAKSVEGFLFPETYSFPRRTTAKQAVEAMLDRFQRVVRQLQESAPPEQWPLKNLHDTVTLASLVESEAAQGDERPLIASVYINRLERRILLQCDPTVIYALELAGRYRGKLTLADLQFRSPYNTYVSPGLPPGPIANPGYASLQAAIQPASTKYLFFVRTAESRHVFSETLADHNRAVAAYRKMRKPS
jgi:UPF0755 protein